MKQKMKEIENQLNAAVFTLTGKSRVVKEGLSSGSLLLNLALSGTPTIGYVYGRIVEIFGPEQSGKTTLALEAVVAAQRKDNACVYVDAEHALDPEYMANLGVDLDNLLINQPDCGEEALECVEDAVVAGAKLIVIDSVAALVPRAELEGDMGDAHMGKQARLMGQAMRKLAGRISKQKAIVIFVNQTRMKIGVIFGSPETTTGGNALKFYATYRLEVRSPRGGAIKGKGDLVEGDSVELGIKSKVKVVKNKVFPPYRLAEVVIRYGQGIDRLDDAIAFMKKTQDELRVGDRTYITEAKLRAVLKNSDPLRREFNETIRGIIKQWGK